MNKSLSFKQLAIIILLLISTFQQSFSYYTTKNGNFIDKKTGEVVILRGFGIGGWLLPEGYMWGIRKYDRPYQFEDQIKDLIGEEAASEFWRLYRTNFLIEEEIKIMKSWGVNSIRIPLLFSMQQPREGQPAKPPYNYSEDGFSYLDTLVKWCEKYHMGIIWDLHGAPGSQNGYNISDGDGVARLWTEKEKYWPMCNELWYIIAKRYNKSECIIGYDLLNEPVLKQQNITDLSLLRKLTIELTKTIRSIDKERIIFIEGEHFSTNFDVLEPLDWDKNLAVAMHSYPPIVTMEKLQQYLKLREKYNVPIWLGETGEEHAPYGQNLASVPLLEKNNVSWSWWTHKKFENNSQPWNIPRTEGFNAILNYWKGIGKRPSAEEAKKWLFEQAEKTNLKYCVFLPTMVQSLISLDPYGFAGNGIKAAPVIISQPENIALEFMQPGFIQAQAKGYPLNYQWFENDKELPGENMFFLKFKNPSLAQNGSKYKLKVYNELGTIFTDEVNLQVGDFTGPYITRSITAPVIDASKDMIWDNVAYIIINNVVDGKRESLTDLTGGYKVLYDKDNLYLWIEIIDDTLVDKANEAYARDCIEFYFDADNDKPSSYGPNEIQYRYAWNTNSIDVIKGQADIKPAVAQKTLKNGYIMEIAFPWASIHKDNLDNPFIGFDIQVNDNDSDSRECKLAWKGKFDNSYKTAEFLGILKLKP
jgi:hypothetical protein